MWRSGRVDNGKLTASSAKPDWLLNARPNTPARCSNKSKRCMSQSQSSARSHFSTSRRSRGSLGFPILNLEWRVFGSPCAGTARSPLTRSQMYWPSSQSDFSGRRRGVRTRPRDDGARSKSHEWQLAVWSWRPSPKSFSFGSRCVIRRFETSWPWSAERCWGAACGLPPARGYPSCWGGRSSGGCFATRDSSDCVTGC
jgi:hypothetical protein